MNKYSILSILALFGGLDQKVQGSDTVKSLLERAQEIDELEADKSKWTDIGYLNSLGLSGSELIATKEEVLSHAHHKVAKKKKH